ncbi:MAG: S41 family peptidase [Oligoflexales bacterium]|nr:S41 family peptidase [Oligoflexales bacterium]
MCFFIRLARGRVLSLLFPFLFLYPVAAAQGPDSKSSPLLLDEKYKALETLSKVFHYLEKMYVDEEKTTIPQQVEYAIDGIIRNLDPHTQHMPKKAFEQLTLDARGQFGGVGIVVTHDKNRLIILSPMDDSPAMKAGIKAGDEILSIEDEISNAGHVKKGKGEIMELMRGPPGSSITLTIKRADTEKPLIFKLTREIIKISSSQMETLSEGIHLIRVSHFQEKTSSEILKFLEDLEKKKVPIRGIILDLRDNPGGLLDQSVKTADLFLESGLIVSTVGRSQDKIEREFAHKVPSFINFPMIVLINRGSASASEIVAGALQDHKRALIMGTPSFGKGSVQTLIPLPDGSGLKITVATYYTPSDRSIQAKGIQPDIVVSKRFTENPETDNKSEADLERHLKSEDLSDMGQKGGLLGDLKNWSESNRTDHQLITAYTYLSGWGLFQKN